MTHDEFDAHLEQTFSSCRDLLATKGGEYSSFFDPLANFKRGSHLAGVSPLQVALIYASKHFDAISNYIKDQAAGKVRPRSEPITGRFHDLINYMVLMEALRKEEEEER